MKLTSMFESASESPVVECSRDGEKSDQSAGALLVPVSSDSCDLSSSKSKIKGDRSSPVLDILNGNGEAQIDLKKTLEPLSLSNGDGASSDDLERISCRTPVGDNDSSSEKENYLFDDGGSEASLKLRITESEDEGEMSPRASSPFEEMDQECRNKVSSQTEDHDDTKGEIKDAEPKCDGQSDGGGDEEEEGGQQQQEEGDAEEPDASSPIVKDQDDEISGKLLKSEDDDGPDTTCVQEEENCTMHAESAGSGDSHSAEHDEPEKSERCCDIASDSDTVKCSCDGVCSSSCTCSVSKQEIGNSNVKPHTESNNSLKLDECTAEHRLTRSGEESGSLSTEDSHISAKESSSNSETGSEEDCLRNTIATVCEQTVPESEATTGVAQNASIDKQSLSEESVTEQNTTGDLNVTNTAEDESSSVEKVGPIIVENDRANTESNSASGYDEDEDNEDGDLTSKDEDCASSLVEPVDNTKTLEVLPAERELNGLSTADEDTNYEKNESSVSNSDRKLDDGVNVSEVSVENERGESDGRIDSETETITESKLAVSENSVTLTNTETFPGEGSDMKNSETDDGKDSDAVKESKLAASQNLATTMNSDAFPGEGSDDTKDSETVEESKLATSQNSVTITNSANLLEAGSDNMKDDVTVKESKLTISQNLDTITNPVNFPGGGSDDMKDSESVDEGDTATSQNSVTVTNSVPVPGKGNDNLKDNETALLLEGTKLPASQNSLTLKNNVDISANSTLTCTEVSQEKKELMQQNVDVSENKEEDKQTSVEMPSEIAQSNINKNNNDTCVDGKGVVCNGTVDDSKGVVSKEKKFLTQESSSSECNKMADNNENVLTSHQTGDPGPRESELEMKGSKSPVDTMVKDSEANEVIGQLEVNGSVEKEKHVDSNMELVNIPNKNSEVEKKNTNEIKDCLTPRVPEGELESHAKLPENGVGGSNKEKMTKTELDRSIVEKTSDDNFVTSVNSCEIEEPLTLSDVANALKDAVDTVTLQEGESVPFSGCEASVPPLSSDVHNLPPPDMLVSDNTSALAVHVADQEVQPENVQEAPSITEAVRRRRKRSIEDVVPDRISKRTRGATLANSSAANSPEKLTQTNSEPAKRPVVESSAEEDPKRMRLSEEYGKVVKRIEQTVAPNGIVTGEIGSRRVFLEKIRAKDLKNLTVAELEEFFVEKICEALAYRHELGVMRQKQQAVENQMEIWRKKSLAMCKQVRDMELVMKRYQNDLKTRKDRPVIPVKVTRSVGLQVHDISSDPSRALLHKRKRMEQQASSVNTTQRPSPQSPLGSNISTAPTSQSASVSTRGTTSSPQYSRTATSMNSQTNTPAAGNRVPAKPNSGLKTLMPRQQSVSVNTNTSTTSPTTANSSRTQQMTRSKVASAAGNSPVGSVNKNSRQVIDLTDDGDRGRTAQARTTAVMTTVNTVPASTTLTPTSSIRILPQPVTATAVAAGANILATGVTTNSTVPRLTYLVPTSNQLQQRPVLLASSPSQGVANAVVTVTSGQKNQAPAVYVKNGAVVSVSPLVGSGAVGQQVTSAARPTGLQPPVAQGSPSRPQIRPAQILTSSPQSRSLPQHAQHPAPLPVAPILNLNNPDLKKMPPRPELKISKQSRHQGIVLSWNMPVTNEYAAIASYQLYAYQESSSPPSTAHWKKVGDVKALPLPMACTLTQFVEGHKYHFAVRAVDIHSRVGPFSLPGSIVLTRK